MQKHKPLPFSIEPHAVSKWLGTLALNKPVQTACEIYDVLFILVKQPAKYQKHLATLLPILTPTIIQLNLYLEGLSYTSEKNLTIKQRKVARLNISLLRYLAILHYDLGTKDDKQQKLCFTNCLQLSYLCLKQSALIYERPSSTLWKIIGKIYQLASKKNTLDTPTDNSVAILEKQKCITDILKTLLLFKLCKPYCLKQPDILTLSDLVEQHNEQLVLTREQSRFCLHIWDYNLPQEVQVITPNTKIPSSTVFLDSHLLIFTLKNENFSSIANIISCNQALVPVLTLTQAPPQTKNISTSFNSAIKLIEQYELTEKINESTINNQDLELFSDKEQLDEVASEDLSQRVSTTLSIIEATVKESSGLGFLLIELKAFSGNAEDLITIFDGEKRPQVGVIRKIMLLKNNQYQLLAEMLSPEVTVITLTTRSDKSKALLFTISNQSTSLLITPHKYTTGSTVQIEEQPFYLTRLLENTENFMLYMVQAH